MPAQARWCKHGHDTWVTGRSHSRRCRVCTRASSKEWKKNNPEADRRHDLRYRLRGYGLSEHHYEQMMLEQAGRCAICHGTNWGSRTRLCVDHCHKTGRVRQLLCNACNSGLGQFRDDPSLLILAAEYIEKHRCNSENKDTYQESDDQPTVLTAELWDRH